MNKETSLKQAKQNALRAAQQYVHTRTIHCTHGNRLPSALSLSCCLSAQHSTDHTHTPTHKHIATLHCQTLQHSTWFDFFLFFFCHAKGKEHAPSVSAFLRSVVRLADSTFRFVKITRLHTHTYAVTANADAHFQQQRCLLLHCFSSCHSLPGTPLSPMLSSLALPLVSIIFAQLSLIYRCLCCWQFFGFLVLRFFVLFLACCLFLVTYFFQCFYYWFCLTVADWKCVSFFFSFCSFPFFLACLFVSLLLFVCLFVCLFVS